MRRIILKLACVSAITAAAMFGQFSSGSTGADGPLNFTTPGTVDFDPVALGINPAGDNIFNFTTINIAAGVTLRLRASKVRNAPILWLATGAVTIAGTLDLSGAQGHAWNGNREPSEPGPGGYAGGVGGSIGSPPTSGAGPGGGANGTATGYGCPGAYGSSFNAAGCSSLSYGNALLIPLRGGSGGGGGSLIGNDPGSGGGAGGGAIQIVTSGAISIDGSILANGGIPGVAIYNSGGVASGGAIHLQAQTISGGGTISATGPSINGRIRIDATTNSFTGTIAPTASFGTPFNTPLPNMNPAVRLVSINSVAVPAAPVGSFTNPDVTINANTAVNINIAGANIPLGTVVKIYLNSETGADQVISCVGLAGTVASSTATCSATFPLGTTATLARAVW